MLVLCWVLSKRKQVSFSKHRSGSYDSGPAVEIRSLKSSGDSEGGFVKASEVDSYDFDEQESDNISQMYLDSVGRVIQDLRLKSLDGEVEACLPAFTLFVALCAGAFLGI